jgi:hypothetical protein
MDTFPNQMDVPIVLESLEENKILLSDRLTVHRPSPAIHRWA